MNHKQIRSMLSLAQKAGKLVSGEYSCEKALQSQQAQLGLIAVDASDNTKQKFLKKTFYYKIPCFLYGSKQLLSQSIGKENRAVIMITEAHFAAKLAILLSQDDEVTL